jgi:hypothetical protein
VECTYRDATTIIATQLSHPVPDSSINKQAIATLKKANIKLAKRPGEIPQLVKQALKS